MSFCFRLSSFSPISQLVDVVDYLRGDALKDLIPEFSAVHHLPIVPINHSQLHPGFTLVQLPPVYLPHHREKGQKNVTGQHHSCAIQVRLLRSETSTSKKKNPTKKKRNHSKFAILTDSLQQQEPFRPKSQCSVH